MAIVVRITMVTLLGIVLQAVNSCKKTYSTDQSIQGPTLKAAICTSQYLTVRADPFLMATKLDYLAKGEEVILLDRTTKKSRAGRKKDYWYKIKKANGIVGWSYGAYLKIFNKDNPDEANYEKEILFKKEADSVAKMLVGKFFSVDNHGIFTKEKIFFFPDNVYVYGRVNANMVDGTFTIDSKTKIIELEKGTTVGKKVTYILAGDVLTLYGKRWGKTVRLVKDASSAYPTTKEENDILPKDLQDPELSKKK